MKTKRLISLLMTLALCLSLLPFGLVPAGAAWTGSGSGTKDDPYQISTKAELEKFRDIVNGANGETQNLAACAELKNNIDLGGLDNEGNPVEANRWTPIGDLNNKFVGAFDGAGYEISRLNVSGNLDYAGLFGYIGKDGVVENLSVSGAVAAETDGCYAGGVAGRNEGTVENCYNTGEVKATATSYAYAGGVVGENVGGTVESCYYLADASDGGQALSADDFKKQDSFVGFNFTNTWYMGADAPKLWAFPTKVSTWSELYDALQNDGGIILTADVKYGTGGGANASTRLQVPSGVTAVLDLAGHTVDRSAGDTAAADGIVIFVHGGNLTLDDSSSGKTGTLTGGNSTGNGGGVYVGGGGIFTMNGGTIRGNKAASLGGGVCVGNGTFTMNGGTISGNTSAWDGGGGGVYVEDGTSFQISGGATVTGNALNGAANNVYLKTGHTITVTGALADDAKIGVTMQTPGVFTSGLSGKGTAANFVSDDTAYAVALNGGEAQLTKAIETRPEVNKVQTDGTKAQPLLKGGESADDFTFRYALGENKTTAPTADWKTDIPEEKDAGVYYVWVKAVSDSNVESTAFCIPAKIIVFPVTFKVANGQWNDGTTGDKSISFIRGENEDLALVLKAEDFPEAGDKPDPNYKKEGSWDPEPPQEKNVSGNETYTFTYTAMDKEPTPAAEFTAAGADSGELSQLVANADYTISGAGLSSTAITAGADGKYAIASGLTAGELSVVKTGNGTTTRDSDAQPIAVTKADAPAGVGATNCTTSANNDGTLTGVDNTMEYQKDGAADWTAIAGDAVTGLTNGTYHVRVKAVGTALASDAADVTVAAYARPSHSGGGSSAPASHSVKMSSAAHGRVTASLANAKAGDKVTLTLTPDAGWQAADVIVKDARGNVISVTKNPDGTYSFVMPDTEVTITPVFEEIKEPGPDTPDDPGGSGGPSGQTDVSDRFTDVSKSAWYHDAVQWAVDMGLMNGTSDTTFEPDGTATRAMVVTMLWRLAGEPVVNYFMPYTDVPQDTWYAEAVRWAASAGAVNGISDTEFGPNIPVTREQLAAILYRYAQAQGKGFTGAWMFLLDYPDAAEVSDWADEAMHWMTMHGIITGMGDGTLAPQDNATRAQIAAMFLRFTEAMAE